MAEVRAYVSVPVTAGFAGLGAPTACAPLLVDTNTGFIYSLKSPDGVFAAGAGGTVTSVAQTFTGGLISVAGSPVTTTGTLALTVAGTSGGIPYFSGAATWASSGILAANAPVIGGGAGTTPSTITAGTNNQFLKGATGAAPAFGTAILASADFVNQGTASTLLHGNAAGNPSWAGVSLTSDTTANQGTTVTVLHGNAAGQPSFGVVTPSDAAGNTTGSGNFVLASGATLSTPTLGVASATSINVGGGGAVASLAQASYTPTLSAGVNITASTMRSIPYSRLANMVFVCGAIDIDPTAAAATSFELSLPVASNISNIWEVGGSCGTVDGQGFRIYGSVANDTAVFDGWTPVTLTNQTITFSFGYLVS